MKDVQKFIIDYIQMEYTIPENTDIQTFNYVQSGYVDSMGMIKFILELEEEFGIEFTEDELDNPDFKVVGRLISIVESKLGIGK